MDRLDGDGQRVLSKLEGDQAAVMELEKGGVGLIQIDILNWSGVGPLVARLAGVGLEMDAIVGQHGVAVQGVDAEFIAHKVAVDDA